jgi:hypothetical protein
MSKKENTDEILAELNRVLARLTGDERRVIKSEFRTALPPAAKSPQGGQVPSEPVKVEQAQAPRPEEPKKPEVSSESIYPSGVSPDQILRIAVFHFKGGGGLPELFFQNFADVLQKTTKKRYYMEKTIVREADLAVFDFKQAWKECVEKSVDAAFVISGEPVETSSPEGLYAKNVTADQVSKRFFYVDLAVEVMLAKKIR